MRCGSAEPQNETKGLGDAMFAKLYEVPERLE
jgi:hypothetical protein